MANSHTLSLVQGQRYQCGFRWVIDGAARDLSEYSWRAQVRRKEAIDAELLLDLGPHLSLAEDQITLQLDVPASTTYALNARRFGDETTWDLFVWPTVDPDDAVLLLEGPATLNAATSAANTA